MKKHRWINYFRQIFLSALVLLLLAGCTQADTGIVTTAAAIAGSAVNQEQPGGWQEITIDQAAQKRSAGAFMLDVREQDEWDALHIPGATLIPLGQLQNRLAELPKDQEIVVYCRSGNRSKTGAEVLSQAGFSNVSSMAGGIKQWQAAGLPTEAGK